MPYIPLAERFQWDHLIDEFLDQVDSMGGEIKPGHLNYFFSTIVWALFNRDESYTKANELVGVLECVKQEFIRRKLNPYEEKKIEQHGDIPA